jgi:hypothetical protein
LLNTILLPRERVIFWGGHGLAFPNAIIGDLFKEDAVKLLSVLESKKTKIVYVLSCFFGGKNNAALGNTKDMIIISAATTEIPCLTDSDTMPPNWRGFLNALALIDQYSNRDKLTEYLAKLVFPFITTKKPSVSNFPHIKFLGAPFKLIPVHAQAMCLNREIVKGNAPLVIENKRLVEVEVKHVKNTLEVKGSIPLIISEFYQVIFEKIVLTSLGNSPKYDFIYCAHKLTKAPLFNNSTLLDTFIIRELTLPEHLLLDAKNKVPCELPAAVYHVVIHRGPSSNCSVFFSTSKNPTRMDSMCIVYDQEAAQWVARASLSIEEFATYQPGNCGFFQQPKI